MMPALSREDAYALGVALGQCADWCRFRTVAIDVYVSRDVDGRKALVEILGEDWHKTCFTECGLCTIWDFDGQYLITIIQKVPVEYYNYVKKVYHAQGIKVRRSGYALFWRRDMVMATLRTHTDISLSPQ